MGNKHSEHHHGHQGPSSHPPSTMGGMLPQSPVPSLNGGGGYAPTTVTANGAAAMNKNAGSGGGGTWRGRTTGAERRNSRLSSPPLPPSSSAASSSSTALPPANSTINSSSTAAAPNKSGSASKPCTPRGAEDGGMGTRKGGGGFLAQFFNGGTLGRKTEKKAAAAAAAAHNSQPNSAPQSPMPLNPTMDRMAATNGPQNHFDVLPDRPAIRLDSRLVCKYEVLSVVGKGSFSQVLRVQDRITKRYYAVKLVSTDQDFGAVNNELTILGRVKHPFVIRLEEVFRSATKLFIVMEMASGGEMYDRVVAKGRYTESEARLAIKMLLTGLDYLHTNLITHRDLKPENLLYSDNRPDARLLITDFGLAHQARVLDEKMAETCGTPEYIAPEILLRIPYSNKVDCWAVGVIAYILMSGIMPFDDDCRSRLYTHIITANYVYYPQFWSGSDQAKHFVDSLLETSAEHRPTAREALHHHWVTGERPKGLSRKEKAPRRDWGMVGAEKKTEDGATAIGHNGHGEEEDEDGDAESNVNGTTVQRTKSSRSIRSVTRSDHGHRVDPREVDQLAEDLQRLAKQRHHHNNNYHGHRGQNGGSGHHHHRGQMNGHAAGGNRPPSSQAENGGGPPYANGQITKNYGVF